MSPEASDHVGSRSWLPRPLGERGTLAERLAVGYGDGDPFVKSWRAELFL